MTEIDQIILSLYEITELEKKTKVQKDELRQELFEYGKEDYKDREYLLPTTTVTVPNIFWATTELTREEFLDRSFPTWDIVGVEEDRTSDITIFVLRKNPLYMPFSWENDELKLSKTATEPTPEIDLETLRLERPDLYESLTTERTIRELDGDKLQQALEEDPEIHSILMRHTKYTREPQQRVGFKSGK